MFRLESKPTLRFVRIKSNSGSGRAYTRGYSMIFLIPWAADPWRAMAVKDYVVSIEDGSQLLNKMFGDSLCSKIRATIRVAKFLTRDLTTKDHAILKPSSPWLAGLRGPVNHNSLNLPQHIQFTQGSASRACDF